MRDIAQQLNEIIEVVEPKLSQFDENDMGFKRSPSDWSKKEILGHLIDSAANNHQRFVRAVHETGGQFPSYDQTMWVTSQRYNEIPWRALITFWVAYNKHLSHLIEGIPSTAKSAPCRIGKEAPVSLEYIIKDYLVHLRHHIKDILIES